jgi:hypothetical protein
MTDGRVSDDSLHPSLRSRPSGNCDEVPIERLVMQAEREFIEFQMKMNRKIGNIVKFCR